MNIKDAYVHVGPSGTNEKALLKDFTITAAQITLTRAIQNDAGTGDKTETITVPIWNQDTTGNAATATKLYSTTLTGAEDLNDLTNTGVYGALATNACASLTNGPSGRTNGEMRLEVIGCANSSDYLFQKYWARGGSGWQLYFRTKFGGSGWSSWVQNIDSGNYTNWVYAKSSVYTKTESDARFVLKAGDTMTGALTVPSLSVTGAATFSQAINGSILGNAATASRLQNARTISLTGNVTGSASFDGSGNISISTTVSGGNADTVDNEHASAFAHREAANNFVHSNNEITMVGSGYSGELYYNYKTTGGTNGNITQYNFCNGAGTVLGSISNGQFSGNAASATKLAASKTIWGQSFDGSTNISGSMSGVTSINNTIYNIISVSTVGAGLKISEINQTLNGIDLSVVNFSEGTDSARPLLLQSNGSTGKVGIGLTVPSYKLDVSGEIHSSTYMLAGSYMQTGTYVTAGTYVEATSYVRAKGNDIYIGSASGSQCHQQYDSTNKVLKFIFD